MQALTGRLRHDFEAAIWVRFVAEPHLPDAASKKCPKTLGEVEVNGFECFHELLARHLIDFADRLCGVFDRSQQVLPLRLEECEAVLGLLQLLERHHVDKTKK